MPLWPGGPPGALGSGPDDTPTVTLYRPAAPNGAAFVVCPADTPPTFLFHTADDATVLVENSLQFAAALRGAKVPYELHVFETGRHGVGLAPDNPVLSAWPRLLERWLRARAFIK
jgi:acetyl esterase/lipase